jgi:exonuclease SbcD
MATLLHTSDWHVGKGLGNVDRLPDHRAALEAVVAAAREHRPDVILHTGDVFDGPRPGHEHVQLAVSALRELAAVAPTVVLAGNHDSQALFGVFTTLLGDDAPLRFISKGRKPGDGGIVQIETTGGERVRIAPLPFVHANRQVDWFGDPERFMGVYAERLRLICALLGEGLAEGHDPGRHVLVFAAHLYVSGAIKAGSERAVHVSDDYAVERAVLPGVSYIALGHIHRPQQLAGTPVTHDAGSPIPLDFGEAGEAKSLVLVDAAPGAVTRTQRLAIDAGRPLHELRGTLADIQDAAADIGEAIVRVTVTSQDPIDNLQATVRELMPDATILEVLEDVASRRREVLTPDTQEGERELTYEELLDAYLADVGTRNAAAAPVRDLFAALRSGETDERGLPPVAGLGELLDAALAVPPSDTGFSPATIQEIGG